MKKRYRVNGKTDKIKNNNLAAYSAYCSQHFSVGSPVSDMPSTSVKVSGA